MKGGNEMIMPISASGIGNMDISTSSASKAKQKAEEKAMDAFASLMNMTASNDDTKVIVELSTLNASDKIEGFGHHDLTLSHPTDIVCRTSDFTCPRTLMIKSDKAARDLNSDLINDLKNEEILEVTIKILE